MTTRRAVLTGLIMAAASTAGLSTGAVQRSRRPRSRSPASSAPATPTTAPTSTSRKARGECGMITTLVNVFNATNKDNIVVKPQIIEWGPYYQQLTARIAAQGRAERSRSCTPRRSAISPASSSRWTTPSRRSASTSHDFTPNAQEPASPSTARSSALPWDTHSWLWHINVNLFKKAGLVDAHGPADHSQDGRRDDRPGRQDQGERPASPTSPWARSPRATRQRRARLLHAALRRRAAASSPNGPTSRTSRRRSHSTAFEFFETITKAGAITKGLDGAAAIGAFLNGDAAVDPDGHLAHRRLPGRRPPRPDSPSERRLHLAHLPQPVQDRTRCGPTTIAGCCRRGGNDDKTRKASLIFLKFLWDHNFNWARGGGHLPGQPSRRWQTIPSCRSARTSFGSPRSARRCRRRSAGSSASRSMSAKRSPTSSTAASRRQGSRRRAGARGPAAEDPLSNTGPGGSALPGILFPTPPLRAAQAQ